MTSFPVSLVVITFNEAAKIRRCLESVPFVDDKVVVDSGSTDDTCAIAADCGARVVHQPWLGFGPQRNFATTQAKNDWILVLDADEFLTTELAREFEARLPEMLSSTSLAGAVLRRTTLFMGAPMRWYRPMVAERLARFYHRGRARWTDARVHESLRFEGPLTQLRASFHHIHNPTLVHKQLKVLRYSELKARDWRDRKRSARMWECPFVFLSTFLRDYIFRLAILDGARGFIVSQTAAAYAVYKRMRYYEMIANPDSVEEGMQMLEKHGIERMAGGDE